MLKAILKNHLKHKTQIDEQNVDVVFSHTKEVESHPHHRSNPPSFTLFQPSLNMPWHEAIAR